MMLWKGERVLALQAPLPLLSLSLFIQLLVMEMKKVLMWRN